jgi:hypothetical protein
VPPPHELAIYLASSVAGTDRVAHYSVNPAPSGGQLKYARAVVLFSAGDVPDEIPVNSV